MFRYLSPSPAAYLSIGLNFRPHRLSTDSADMRFLKLAVSLLFSTSTVVSAWQCLSDADAKKLIDNSVDLLEHPDPEAAAAASYADLSPNIVQYGDSINVLYGDPVRNLIYQRTAPILPSASLEISLTITPPAWETHLHQFHRTHRRCTQPARPRNHRSAYHPRLLLRRLLLGVQ